jgi:hypothetical protein
MLRWAESGLCLDVRKGDTSWGARPQLWWCTEGNANQKFVVERTASNHWVVRSRLANVCLDRKEGGWWEWAHLHWWGCDHGNGNQLFGAPGW